MNLFDIVVCAIALVAIVTGFNAGLLRSMASILGYITATPLAVAASAWVSPANAHPSESMPGTMTEGSLMFVGVFIGGGLVLGALLRAGLNETIGPAVSIPDRLAGGMLGFVRIGLVATTVVLIFDLLIPAGRDPAFLQGSQIRPMLSAVGRTGLKSLPPDIVDYINQIKRRQS